MLINYFVPIQIIVISSFASYTPLEYMTATGRYVYPEYANVIGWMIALSSMCMIPGYAIYKLAITKGTLKEVHFQPLHLNRKLTFG